MAGAVLSDVCVSLSDSRQFIQGSDMHPDLGCLKAVNILYTYPGNL